MQHPHDGLSGRITPPSSLIVTPTPTPALTPPPTDSKSTKLVLKIIDVLRQYRDGGQISESPWRIYYIQRDEYDDLISLVEKDESLWPYIEDKLRYDYDSSIGALTLRMPTSYVHEVFLGRVVEEIQNRIRAFTLVEGRLKAFAQDIIYLGSATLRFKSKIDGHIIIRSPDAMFKHCNARWPGIIIEVSYSQKRKDLPRLADNYILETRGSVRIVVGLDIDYKTKKGTISIWRPNYVRNEQGQTKLKAYQTCCNQVFRDESGIPPISPDIGLRLELEDFAPGHLAIGISGSFLIDSAMLCQFLNKAEKVQQEFDSEQGVELDLLPGTEIEYGEETPPEEVSSDGNANDRRRGSEDDSPYSPSPSPSQ